MSFANRVKFPVWYEVWCGMFRLYGKAMRLIRLVLLTVWIGCGLLALAFCFPWFAAVARGEVTRTWSRGLLKILGVRCRVEGAWQRSGGLVVANHVSWLDPFVLLSIHPMHFVAKAEIRQWPVFGWLAAHAGTVFVDRERPRDVGRVAKAFGGRVEDGELVALFPEATTSDGSYVRSFKTALFQVAVTQAVPCLPVALAYAQPEAVWIDDMSFMQSVWRMTALARLEVRVVLCAAILPMQQDRRDLARQSEQAIAAALSLPVRRSRPETDGGPPA